MHPNRRTVVHNTTIIDKAIIIVEKEIKSRFICSDFERSCLIGLNEI